MVHSDVKYSPLTSDESPSPSTGKSCLDAMLGAAPSFRSHEDYSALPADEDETTTSERVRQPQSAGYWDTIKTAASSCRAAAAVYSSLPQDDTETLPFDAAGQNPDSTGGMLGHNTRTTQDYSINMSNAEEMETQEDYLLHSELFGAGDTQPLMYDHTFQHKPTMSPLRARVHTTCRYVKTQMRITDRYVRTKLHTSKSYASDGIRTLVTSLDPFGRWMLRGSRLCVLLCLVLSVVSITLSSLAYTRTNDLHQHMGIKDDHQMHAKLNELESDFNGRLDEGHQISRKAHDKIEKMNATLHEQVNQGLSSSAQAHEKIDQLEKSFDAKLDDKHRSLDAIVNDLRMDFNHQLENERQISRRLQSRVSTLQDSISTLQDRVSTLQDIISKREASTRGGTYFGIIPESTVIYLLSAAVVVLLIVLCIKCC